MTDNDDNKNEYPIIRLIFAFAIICMSIYSVCNSIITTILNAIWIFVVYLCIRGMIKK